MRAAWFEKFGKASEVLKTGEFDTPVAAAGEVLIRLHTSGINPSDVKKRAGSFPDLLEEGPVIPNSDGAGVIEAVGADVPARRVGERVWIYQAQFARRFGTAAEYVAIASERAPRLPDNVDFDVGACLGIPVMTAHRCVFADGSVEGQTILQRQRQLLAQRFDAIAMVGDTMDRPDSSLMHSLPDRVGGKGPLDGIAAGLAWSPEDWLFVLASDMPYPCLPLLDALLDARHEDCEIVCVMVEGREQPIFALYHRRLLPIVDGRMSRGLLRATDLVREAMMGVRVEKISEADRNISSTPFRISRNSLTRGSSGSGP